MKLPVMWCLSLLALILSLFIVICENTDDDLDEIYKFDEFDELNDLEKPECDRYDEDVNCTAYSPVMICATDQVTYNECILCQSSRKDEVRVVFHGSCSEDG